MTEGVLVKEAIKDRKLSKYDFLIIDEAHERGINMDLLLGFAKFLSKTKSPLKIIIMSATLEIGKLESFFKNKRLSSGEPGCDQSLRPIPQKVC